MANQTELDTSSILNCHSLLLLYYTCDFTSIHSSGIYTLYYTPSTENTAFQLRKCTILLKPIYLLTCRWFRGRVRRICKYPSTTLISLLVDWLIDRLIEWLEWIFYVTIRIYKYNGTCSKCWSVAHSQLTAIVIFTINWIHSIAAFCPQRQAF